MPRRMRVIAMACIALWSGAGLGAAAPLPTELIIRDVTVIDPSSGQMLDHRSVHIAAGKIIKIEPALVRNASGSIAADGIEVEPALVRNASGSIAADGIEVEPVLVRNASGSIAADGIEVEPARVRKGAGRNASAGPSGPGQGGGTQNNHAAALLVDAERNSDAATVLDGAGKFLIPGLWDMHSHLRDYVEYALPMHIAFGVTGIRDMSGDCPDPKAPAAFCIDDVRQLNSRVSAGTEPGPRVLWASSDFVHGPELRSSLPGTMPKYLYPATAEEGRLVAEHWQARSVDFIKTYNGIPPAAYFALADRARELGIEVSGHVPLGVSTSEAAAHGHKTIEHARSILYDCSDYGPEYRAAMAAVASGVPNANTPDSTERMRRTVNEFDAQRCEAILSDLAKRGVYYTPTHLTRESDARASDAAYRNDPRLKYVIPKWREYWESNLNSAASKSAEVRELYQRFHELGLRVTGMAHAAGVKILAGTDAFDTMIFPGASLHDEFALLHKAGLSPMEVLRTATTNAAEYLGLQRQYGAVREGWTADLVLLNANPLHDIRNTREIAAVIVGGRWYERAQLDGFLRDAERYVEQAKANVAPSVEH
ncbi:amidohydrolase family protein [Peristeroidobacter soli]|uniref:amidohydrolase family protein n=1 Tax=Peristeroidobacter soli TaxID=2497877 RepID=UPI00130062FF|nr:amidohydrolase family protein [Peristeroidobacter soli]